MTANGMIELFPQGKFGNRVIGSDAAFAELVLAHDSVSRKHAQLERREDDPNALYVTDLGSSNGTYHQGLDIRGRGTVRVGNRERLQFGLFAALVDISEE
jgi:pSer/pThr/pTyr-binding forkhead associated (FHA) protein